jgi:hypothetical protein
MRYACPRSTTVSRAVPDRASNQTLPLAVAIRAGSHSGITRSYDCRCTRAHTVSAPESRGLFLCQSTGTLCRKVTGTIYGATSGFRNRIDTYYQGDRLLGGQKKEKQVSALPHEPIDSRSNLGTSIFPGYRSTNASKRPGLDQERR